MEKSKSSLSVKFAFFMFLVMALVFLPSSILFFVCMIPTIVSLIVESREQKTAWMTVGVMNLAGTIPIWVRLLEGGHTLSMSFQLILEPLTIMVSYGGAFIGWFIYINVTRFVAGIIIRKNEIRLKAIRKRQAALVKKWGKEVIS